MSAHFSGRHKPDEPAKDATGWKIQANEKHKQAETQKPAIPLFFTANSFLKTKG
jgi:hypothetical protein